MTTARRGRGRWTDLKKREPMTAAQARPTLRPATQSNHVMPRSPQMAREPASHSRVMVNPV